MFLVGKVAAFVLPQFVTNASQLYSVRNEYNGMVLQRAFADKQFLYGKGAGRYPTASAVLSDISALRYDYRYEYRKYNAGKVATLSTNFYLNIYVSFKAVTEVNPKDFEMVEEFRTHQERSFAIGIISYTKILKSRWIRNPSVSVIVIPEGIRGSIGELDIKRRSLELGGAKVNDTVSKSLSMGRGLSHRLLTIKFFSFSVWCNVDFQNCQVG